MTATTPSTADRFGTAAAARRAIRTGEWTAHTSGLAPANVQGNVVILPAAQAADFLRFCQANPKPCPLLAVSDVGEPLLPTLGHDVDIRSDVPAYRVYRDGVLAEDGIATSIHPQGADRRRRAGRPGRFPCLRPADTIKVGVLHSLSGTMAISETTLKDTVLMAIEEINAKGGVLGKKLEPVVVDPASNWPLFAEKTKQLLTPGQGRRDLRLLDLGVAQVGAAGGRGNERPAVLPRAVRG
jgi:ABC-type branched-subunit amino acid transport system substrate-binding protein